MKFNYHAFEEFVTKNITEDNSAKEQIVTFFLRDFNHNPEFDEYVSSSIAYPALINDIENLFIPKVRIFVSIKNTTIVLLAALCDIFVTKGIASAIATALGILKESISLIDLRDICVLSQIMVFNSLNSATFTENDIAKNFNNQCQRSLNKRISSCPFSDNPHCTINKSNISDSFLRLVQNGVIMQKGEEFRVEF